MSIKSVLKNDDGTYLVDGKKHVPHDKNNRDFGEIEEWISKGNKVDVPVVNPNINLVNQIAALEASIDTPLIRRQALEGLRKLAEGKKITQYELETLDLIEKVGKDIRALQLQVN